MERQKVESHNIKSIGYDVAGQVLEVEFNTGALYQYFSVPDSIYDAFMRSSSKGKYFYANIRDKFEYKRVT